MNTAVDVVRVVYFVTALQLVGLLIFRLVFSARDFSGPVFRRLALSLTAGVVVAMLVWFPFEAGSMSGESLEQATGSWGTVLAETRFGHVWIARLILFLAAGALLSFRRDAVFGATAVAALGLALSAASGHAGAGTIVQLIADMVHLIAVAAWIGGLLPFAWIMTRHIRADDDASFDDAYDAASRFSWLGIVCVGAILISGGINSWYLVGSIPALIGTDYGRLLSLKIVLFAAIVAIAALNRLRLTPRIKRRVNGAARALRRNALIETAIGAAIISIVGALGTMPPAAHDQPVWPFSFRIEWTPFLIVTKAYPTSFVQSPLAFAAPSIARGMPIYQNNCAACHGPEGRGDGPAAASLPVKPANLLELHVMAHLDGELFWWISHGIGDAMPGFDGVLSERDRWDVIDFVRARNAAFVARELPDRVGGSAAPSMPDFAFEADGRQQTLSQTIRQSPVLVVVHRGSPPPLKQLGVPVLPVDLDDAAPDVAATLQLFLRPGESEAAYLIDQNDFVRAGWRGDIDQAAFAKEVEKMKSLPLTRAAVHRH